MFFTTRWSVVQGWAEGEEEEAQRCLGSLCEDYWRPLYRFARRRGKSPSDAEDLVQGFFEALLSREGSPTVERARGKFRAYLLAAFKNHMADEWRWARRAKRGGGAVTLSLDWESEESAPGSWAEDRASPDVLFDRDWARVLLDAVLAKVEQEFAAEGKAHEFEAMRGCLAMDSKQVKYSELAETLGMREGAVRVAVHRLRKRYRTTLRKEVAQTLVGEESVEEEMQALFLALTGG